MWLKRPILKVISRKFGHVSLASAAKARTLKNAITDRIAQKCSARNVPLELENTGCGNIAWMRSTNRALSAINVYYCLLESVIAPLS